MPFQPALCRIGRATQGCVRPVKGCYGQKQVGTAAPAWLFFGNSPGALRDARTMDLRRDARE
jgi:hypothetical protein